MAWYVYILRCADGTLYTGCTNDLARRLNTHQAGKGAKYTRSRLPVELAYSEATADKSQALRREAAIKRLSRQEKIALTEGTVSSNGEHLQLSHSCISGAAR